MTKLIQYPLLLATLILFAGCASDSIGPTRNINDPSNSLVFGYVDMTDAPTKIEGAILEEPQGEKDIWHMTVAKDGQLITQALLPLGSYQVALLRGSGFLVGERVYRFPAYGRNKTALRIQKPGVYFMGSFRYKKVKTGLFEDDQFTIESVQSPTELELLQRLQKEDWVKGTQWEARIRSRIQELRK